MAEYLMPYIQLVCAHQGFKT